MLKQTVENILVAPMYTLKVHMSAGGGQNGLSEIILNNLHILALMALFFYAKCDYALGVFACPKVSLPALAWGDSLW